MSEPREEAASGGPRPPRGTLTVRTLNGFLWTFSSAGFQAVLKILVLAILARLLTPNDFGVVTAALTIVALADLFRQVGVAPSIVQAPLLTAAHIRTAFTTTALLGVAVAGLTLVLAPLIAGLFQIAAMESVVRAFCLIFIIRGFATVAEALLQRDMRFGAMAINSIASYLFGYALVAVGLASAGFGIWALVFGQITQTLMSSVGLVLLARHSMVPMMDLPILRHLLNFGTGLTLARVGNYVATNADYFVVGRWLGAEALGFYSRAYLLLMQPAHVFGSAADKVLFPAMASIQGERERLARAYYRSMSLIALATLPLSAVIAVLAPEIIEVLLGSRWTPVVVPFQILAASLFFRTAYKITMTLLRARGSVYVLASWQWIYALSIALGAWWGQFYGMAGVAVGVSLAITFSFWIGVLIARATISISLLGVLGILGRYAILMLAVGMGLWLLKLLLTPFAPHPLLTLAAGGALCLSVMLMVWLFLPRLFGAEGPWIRSLVASRLGKRLGGHHP